MFDLRSLTRTQREARAEQFPPDTADDRLIADLTLLGDALADAGRDALQALEFRGVDPVTQGRLHFALRTWEDRAR